MWSVLTKEVQIPLSYPLFYAAKTKSRSEEIGIFHKVTSWSWQLEQDNVICCNISEFKVYYTSKKKKSAIQILQLSIS